MKLLTVIGARPQFVKAATVSREILQRGDMSEVIIHTGQHYDANMSQVFFDELDIPAPHYHLGIGGSTHGKMTGRQLEAIESVLLEEKPDWVVVYGDTNSTLAGALAAVKLHIPVAHIEAGVRSFNRQTLEEFNRTLTDHAATLLLAPTETAIANLRREGIAGAHVQLVGDVMYDATLHYKSRAKQPAALAELKLAGGEFVLATLHRAENVDVPERLSAIIEGLGTCGRSVVLPLHPRTKARMAEDDITVPSNIRLIEPASYLEMVWLESNAAVIATDSGGVQKEACFLSRPCIIFREETEWLELVEAGWSVLVGADAARIAQTIGAPADVPNTTPPYGEGTSSRLIVDEIARAGGLSK